MFSAVFLLASKSNNSQSDACGCVTSGFLVDPGTCNRSPMPGLDSLDMGHRIVEPFISDRPAGAWAPHPMPDLGSPRL